MDKLDFYENPENAIKTYVKTGYSSYMPAWKWDRVADTCTLYYVISGEVRFSLDGKNYDCVENDVFFLTPSERARISNPSTRQKASLYYVIFELQDDASPCDLGMERPIKDVEHSLFEICRGLYKTRLAQGRAHALLEKALFLRLVYELITYKQNTEECVGSDLDLERTVRYMKMNFYKQLSVEELAKFAGYSTSHFRRLFVENYGVSPHEYLLNYKIERAKELLVEEEGRSVDEVADILGTCNSSYFCKLFKKKTGVSPHKFKKDNNVK